MSTPYASLPVQFQHRAKNLGRRCDSLRHCHFVKNLLSLFASVEKAKRQINFVGADQLSSSPQHIAFGCFALLQQLAPRLPGWVKQMQQEVALSTGMADDLQQENVKLIVTKRGIEPTRYVKSALRNALTGARVRGTGFRGVFALEAKGDAAERAKLAWRECAENIGHITAVCAMVESREEAIKDAAASIGAAQIGADESFCFRLHKRGAHGLEKPTSRLEPEIGATIWAALEVKYNKKPKVSLNNPDITVVAEILGPIAWVGISRRAWRE